MRRVLILLLAAAVLTGCVSFPESGPVHRGIEGAPEPEAISLVAEEPQPGDSPEQIVRGFLNGAAAGTTDDFGVARSYLTDESAEVWNPGAQVTIYAGGDPLVVEETQQGTVQVSVTISGTVDETGVYTPAPAEASSTFDFGLTEDAQEQWRISELDDGVLVSEVIFGSQYRQVPLYFLTPDATMLVPDTRWYPQRNASTAAMRGLLAGPAPWLDGAVFSAMPADTSLSFGAVTVSGGTAQVDLSAEALQADATTRQLIRAQIEQTLLGLPQVQRVEITVDGVDWDAPVPGLEVSSDPPVGRTPLVLETVEYTLGTFTSVANEPVTRLDNAVPLGDLDPRALALGYGDEPVVMLSGTDHLMAVPSTDEPDPEVLAQAPDLAAPSYDRHGWIWTGTENNAGELLAVRSTGEMQPVDAEMLDGGDLLALRVSREGARVAVVVEIDGVISVEVHAVVRDEAGVPQRLEQGVQVQPQLVAASAVVWVDEQHLAVLGMSGSTTTVHLSPVGGRTQQLPTVPDVVHIASARGDRELYAATTDGDLYARSGLGWRRVASDVALPTFPG